MWTMGRIVALAIAVSWPLAARTEEPAASAEPIWETVLLAPGRVVANGRFDAATPSYHERKAQEKAESEAAAAGDCPCDCAKR
jgi:hypothetical protein